MLAAECPSIPGRVSKGRNQAEALADIREAQALGRAPPKESP